ncbi:MAG TPA: hypothetical protein VFS97_11435 [Nitrososphaeraceae archaeon]|nr:hypothetical protein [Nitrososphaeraceae archaeon]
MVPRVIAHDHNIVSGDYLINSQINNSNPIVAKSLKAGSVISPKNNKRIILHPEKQRQNQDRTRKLAELARIIMQISQPREDKG